MSGHLPKYYGGGHGRYLTELLIKASMGVRLHEVMRADERAKGHRVVVPGGEPWLPAVDWDATSVVSVDGNVVRLVAILALNPGNGAFRRLIAAIQTAGLTPHISTPTREMRDTLRRWGWKGKHRGWGDDVEEIWKPRAARS